MGTGSPYVFAALIAYVYGAVPWPMFGGNTTTVFGGSCIQNTAALAFASAPQVVTSITLGTGLVMGSPVIGTNNTIFIGSLDFHLYAVGEKREEERETETESESGNENESYSTGLALEVLWSFATNGPVYSTPSISHDGETVYVGGSDEFMYALSAISGNLLWQSDSVQNGIFAGGSVPARFANNEYVLATDTDWSTWIFDASTGKVVSQVLGDLSTLFATPCVLPNGDWYIGSNLSDFMGFSQDRLQFTTKLGKNANSWGIHASVSVSLGVGKGKGKGKGKAGTGIVGADSGTLYAVDLASGNVTWSTQLGSSPIQAAATISADGQTCFVGIMQSGGIITGVRHGVDQEKNRPRGENVKLLKLNHLNSVDLNLRNFFAVSVSTGKILWSVGLEGKVAANAVLDAAGVLCVAMYQSPYVFGLNATNGKVVWKVDTGQSLGFLASPAVDSDGRVVLVSELGNVVVLG